MLRNYFVTVTRRSARCGLVRCGIAAGLLMLVAGSSGAQETSPDEKGTVRTESNETVSKPDSKPTTPAKASQSNSTQSKSATASAGQSDSAKTNLPANTLKAQNGPKASENDNADSAVESKPEVAQPVRPGVWTVPPNKSEPAADFQMIGEFVGETTDESPKRLALQIRAVGSGQFEARQTEGGLPGEAGFDESTTIRLIGRRSGETLVLSGATDALFVTPERCTIINANANVVANLQRVRRASPTLGAQPPKDAIVLYRDPKQPPRLSEFLPGAKTDGDLLAEGALLQPLLQDFDLHLEFMIPHMPEMREQKRGNSGVYLQSRYECQVLDSFGTDRVFNGLGSLYRIKPADINMAFPPLTWQTYDIRFTAARFNADGTKRSPARVTSYVNGVRVQNDVELHGPTGHGEPESPEPLPTKLQNHNDPVRYRNIWIIDRGLTPGIAFPPKQVDEASVATTTATQSSDVSP